MSIRLKILSGFGVLVLILALFGANIYLALQSIAQNVTLLDQVFQQTVRYDVTSLDLSVNSKSELNDYQDEVKDYLSSKGATLNDVNQELVKFETVFGQLHDNVAQAHKANISGPASETVSMDTATIQRMDQEYAALKTSVAQGRNLLESGQTKAAQQFYQERVKADFNTLHDTIVAFQRALESRSTDSLGKYQNLTGSAQASIQSLTQTTLIALLTSLALALVASYVISELIAKPVHQIATAAEAVEQGDYHEKLLTPLVRARDELGHLARVFDKMAEQVAAKEKALKQQIQSLVIQIDEQKRQKQVEDVVDTDAFREIQAKALELRKKRAGGSPTHGDTPAIS